MHIEAGKIMTKFGKKFATVWVLITLLYLVLSVGSAPPELALGGFYFSVMLNFVFGIIAWEGFKVE